MDKGGPSTAALAFSPTLSRIDTHRVVAVLEKAIERLQLLALINYDVGGQEEGMEGAEHSQSPARGATGKGQDDAGRGVGSILEEQKRLEARYEQLIMATQKVRQNPLDPVLDPTCFSDIENPEEQAALEELRQVSAALREQSKLLCRQLKDNPHDGANWKKVVGERNALITTLSACVRELSTSSTTVDNLADGAGSSLASYEVFAKTVQDEQSASIWAEERVRKEKELNKNVKSLEGKVRAERALKEEELERAHKEIGELKTELRILKQQVKDSMEKLRAETEAAAEAQQREAFDVQRLCRNDLIRQKDQTGMEQQVNQDLQKHIDAKIKFLDEETQRRRSEIEERQRKMLADKHLATTKRDETAAKLEEAKQRRIVSDENKTTRVAAQASQAKAREEEEKKKDERYRSATILQAAVKGFFTRQALIPLKKKFGKKKK